MHRLFASVKAPGAVDKLVGRDLAGWCLGGVGLGVAASLLVALTGDGGPFWSDGFLLVLYLLATASIAGVLGFIFAVPRARAENGEGAVRFLSNSNLEQISDWLTKILVGAGLVQLATLPDRLSDLGDYLGSDLQLPNGPTASVAVTVYGAGVGFVFVYLWTRLRYRVMLETSERLADAEARATAVLEHFLGQAATKPGQAESSEAIARTTANVAAVAMRNPNVVGKRVLWVDDNPSNNIAEQRVLEAIGIMVEEARSTADAIEMLKSRHFDLVISDLGRTEGATRQPEAGVELIDEIKRLQLDVPVFIYGTQEAYRRRNDLMQKGAADVFTRPTELIERVANELARR